MAKVSKVASSAVPPADLYERDYYAWILEQVRALHERRVGDIDWENVAEEIEDLGKSEKRAVKSQIERLFEHLLKLAYAQGRMRQQNRQGWEVTVEAARSDVRALLTENPSLRPIVPEILQGAYLNGRAAAIAAIRVDIPKLSPWTFEKIMDDAFLPGEPA